MTKLGGIEDLSCKVLQSYLMDACVNKFKLIDCELFG